MSQQINLFGSKIRTSGKAFSVVNMAQGLAAILFLVMLFYAYQTYQLKQMEQSLTEARISLDAEQTQLASLTANFALQRAGMTPEEELKKITDEAIAQRAIISALKSGVIGNTRGYSEYMQAFARQMVNGLWLTGFSIDGDATKMSISGAALSAELVPGYIMRLNNEKVMRGKNFSSLKMQLPKKDAKKDDSKPASKQYLEFELQSVVAGEAAKQ